MLNLRFPYLAYPRCGGRRPRVAGALALCLVVGVAAWSPATHAASRRDKAGAARASHKVAGKVAVFPIRYDDDHSISAQLQRLLRSRGLEVVTDVRPVDTPEQYRELAGTLGLAALIGGRYDEGDKNARLTLEVRNGYTGRRLIAATFKQNKLNMRTEVEGKLWNRIGPAVARACADASKPRRRGRAPLLIEAGTSLASSTEN
jgi:hypothetical protein